MKTLLLLWMAAFPFIACTQESATSGETKEAAKSTDESKLEQFTSRSGEIIRTIEYSLPRPKLRYKTATAAIRSIHVGKETGYFLIIESEEEYRTNRAAIAHEDLLEVIKALTVIKEQAPKDAALAPEYLENRFVTEDGFMVGYFVSKGEVSWFMRLERSSGSTIFPKDETEITNLLNEASGKINELKAATAE